MRKMAMFCTLVGIVLLASACGSKKLVCTSTGTDIGKKNTTRMEVIFDGKKATKINEKISFEFEEGYRDSIDTYYNVLKETYKEDILGEGVKVDITKGDTNIDVKLTIDVTAQENSDSASSEVDTSKSRADMKKEFESKGYSCK